MEESKKLAIPKTNYTDEADFTSKFRDAPDLHLVDLSSFFE